MLVRIVNNIVEEIFPDEMKTVADIAKYFSDAYAAATREAPDDIGIRDRWVYDPDTDTYSPPLPVAPEEITAMDVINIILDMGDDE